MSPEEIIPLLELMSIPRYGQNGLHHLCNACDNNKRLDDVDVTTLAVEAYCKIDWNKQDHDYYEEIEKKHNIPCLFWSPP